MKKQALIKLLAILLIAGLLWLMGCKNDNSFLPQDTELKLSMPEVDLTVSRPSITLSAKTKTLYISLQAAHNVSWKAQSADHFIDVTPTKVNNGNGTIQIVVANNDTENTLTGHVNIENITAGKSVVLTIIQNKIGKPEYFISPAKVFDDISDKGGEFNVAIVTNPVVGLSFKTISGEGWIKKDESTTTWTVDPNETNDIRKGKVYIMYNEILVLDSLIFIQKAVGQPQHSITPTKEVNDIVAQKESKYSFTITTAPVTPLSFTSNVPWIVQDNSGETSWTVLQNTSLEDRSGKVYITYGAQNKMLDSILFNQLRAPKLGSPILLSDENSTFAYSAIIRWTVDEIFTSMKISVNGVNIPDVNVQTGEIYLTGLNPGEEHTVIALANDGKEDATPSELKLTTKALTDLYTIKDPKMLSNFATYFYAVKNMFGTLRAANIADLTVLANGKVSYGELASIQELILTDNFGASVNGLTDLMTCVNLKRIQIGCSEAIPTTGTSSAAKLIAPDNLIGVDLSKKVLQDMLNKKYLPNIESIGIWVATKSAISSSAIDMIEGVCAENGIICNNPVSISLKLPNTLTQPTTVATKTTTSDLDGLLDRSAWKIVSWTDQEKTPSGTASYPECFVEGMLDGELKTCYHSAWKTGRPPLPHTIVIDMGQTTTINQIVMCFRNGTGGARGTNVETYTIEFSNDSPSAYPIGTPQKGDVPSKNEATMGDFALLSFPNTSGTAQMIWNTPIEVINNPETTFGTNTFTLQSPITARSFRLSFTRVQDVFAGQAVNPSEFGFR